MPVPQLKNDPFRSVLARWVGPQRQTGVHLRFHSLTFAQPASTTSAPVRAPRIPNQANPGLSCARPKTNPTAPRLAIGMSSSCIRLWAFDSSALIAASIRAGAAVNGPCATRRMEATVADAGPGETVGCGIRHGCRDQSRRGRARGHRGARKGSFPSARNVRAGMPRPGRLGRSKSHAENKIATIRSRELFER